jgi:hypothetical protein
MGAFYVPGVMRWVGEWVQRGPTGRSLLAEQLRLLRVRHGRSVARAFRDHLVWIGAYPGR